MSLKKYILTGVKNRTLSYWNGKPQPIYGRYQPVNYYTIRTCILILGTQKRIGSLINIRPVVDNQYYSERTAI